MPSGSSAGTQLPSFGPIATDPDTSISIIIGTPPTNTTQVPTYHSYSAAAAKLYLDFDGHHQQTWGDYQNIDIPPFDTDGDPTTFSTAELAAIENIWRRVSEDYAPFNIDVTTEEPADFSETTDLRVVVGGDGAWTGGANGGISYTGSFANSIPNVVFVFPSCLGNGDPKLVADSISHEAGHAFGLEHQSLYDQDGNLVDEYNPGDANRAPIMGNSLGVGMRSVWWLGPTDQSVDTIQDDMAVIAGSNNGFGWRPDDVADTPDGATALQVNNAFVSGQGIIGKMDDVDYWSFNTDDGVVLFQVSVPSGINNLDAKAELLDAAGNEVVGWQDPADSYGVILAATVPAGSYRLVVGSHGAYGDVGQYWISGVIVPLGSVVDPPTELTAKAVGASEIDLHWTDNANDETGYVVQSTTDGYTWTPIAELGADSTSYASVGLQAGTNYAYRVYAKSSLAESIYSNEASAATLPAPAAPTDLTATAVGSDAVHLAWQDNADSETAYVVERSFGLDWLTIATLPADTTSFDDAGLAGDTTYTYRVHAIDGAAPSDYSNLASATTAPAAPNTPTDLMAITGGTAWINLTWKDAASNETGYVVERSLNGSSWAPIANLSAGSASYQNTGLSALTTYYYRVHAMNGGVASDESNIASAKTLISPPLAPTGLKVLATSISTVTLTWMDRSSNETNFKVLRSLDGVNWAPVGVTAANVKSLRVAKPTRGHVYYFKVVAVNAGGDSASSNIIVVKYNSLYYRSVVVATFYGHK